VNIHEFSKVLSLIPFSATNELGLFVTDTLLKLVFSGKEGELINVLVGYLGSFPDDAKRLWELFIVSFEGSGSPIDILIKLFKRVCFRALILGG
jgi:hypothetical protein